MLFKPGYDTIFGRMEVGFFFMPKIERREFRWQKKKVRCNNANQHSGGGSRARKNHIGMY